MCPPNNYAFEKYKAKIIDVETTILLSQLDKNINIDGFEYDDYVEL